MTGLLAPSRVAFAQTDPYLVQPQVQSDLENLLGRLIPPEQFLVQVSVDVGTRQERQIVEGETITITPDAKSEEAVRMMPGFLPEVRDEPEREPRRSRQTYRMVEKPFLRLVRASVTFDDAIDSPTHARAKQLVQNYLRTAYPNQAIVSFSSLQMLKPKKDIAPEEETKKAKKKDGEDDEEEDKKKELLPPNPWEEYGPWALGAAFLLLLWIWSSQSRRRAIAEAKMRMERRNGQAMGAQNPMYGFDGRGGMINPLQFLKGFGSNVNSDDDTKVAEKPNRDLRKILLHRFLSRSQAFKRYYAQLPLESQEELYGCLRGAAFDNLLLGLNIKLPGDVPEPPEKDEALERHEKDFEEFIQAKDWKDKQFFGFLNDLTDEQLMALINHQTPLGACLMLRFMTPHQSARILDSIPSKRRREIMEMANQMNAVSFSEILAVEREVRENVQRMPSHLFGSNREDIEYWGSVLTEAENQDGILKDIEQTNPGIYPSLKKYKFKLEDAASLPNSLLEKILSESDNDELSLALATCPHELVELFLDAVSPKRREIVEYQLASSRNATPQEKSSARLQLTKRFREVMG